MNEFYFLKRRGFHVSLSLEIPAVIYKEIDKTLFSFILSHYVKKDILCNLRRDGGFEALSFETLNNTFKIKC